MSDDINIRLSADPEGVKAGFGQAESAAKTGADSMQASLERLAAGTRKAATEMQAAISESTAGMQAATARTAEFAKAVDAAGNSAKQTAQALRYLPMQMTDVIVGLSTGQSPFMVLMQQGGQLKDAFGGVGAAAKAVGGYVLGMVNPMTVAAAAASTLAYAFYKGRDEAEQLRREMILGGNAFEAASGRLQDMAKAVSQVVGTQGAASVAVAALATTGKVSYAQLEQATTAAVRVQRELGLSAEEVAKDYGSLAKSPVDSVLKLNESLNFLTASTFKQVVALEQQGRSTDAARLAQDAYTQALNTRMGEIEANLGSLERGWRAVKDAAKATWDAMLNIGREDTLTQKLQAAEAQLDKLQKAQKRENTVGLNLGRDKQIEDAQALVESLREQIRLQDRAAAAKADSAESERAGVAWEAEKLKYASKQEQMKAEIARAERAFAAAGKDAVKDAAELNAVLSQIREKYKTAKPPEQSRVREFQSELAQQQEAWDAARVGQQGFYTWSLEQTRDFWQRKLSIVGLSERDRFAVERQAAQATLAMRKEAFDREMADLKLSMAEARKSADERIAIAKQIALRTVDEYGPQSVAAKEAAARVIELEIQKRETLRRIQLDANATRERIAASEVAMAQQDADFQVQMGRMSLLERAKLEEQLNVDLFQIRLQRAQDDIAALQEGTVEYARAVERRLEIEQQYEQRKKALADRTQVVARQPQAGFESNAAGTLASGMDALLNGTKTRADALRDVYTGIYRDFMSNMVTKPLSGLLFRKLQESELYTGMMAKIAAYFGVQETSAVAAAKAEAAGVIPARAATAAAGAAESVAAIPVVGPELAATAYAETMAMVMGGLAVASAAGGFDIPAGVNPLTQLHAEEMVLPAKYANPLREQLADGGGLSGGGTTHIHVNVQAIDGDSVQRFFRDNADHVFDAVKDSARGGRR